jgi:lysine-N-methylase
MKINIFMPKYMADFKCISSNCTDTCCAGWDINIDEDTYNRYVNSHGRLKSLLGEKFTENKYEHDFFNGGFMVLELENKCPFLNPNMLCDIHGNFGEENLCITCKNYPRVFNIVDGVYEKSGLPSCIEVCTKALLNKDKMEFKEYKSGILSKRNICKYLEDTPKYSNDLEQCSYVLENYLVNQIFKNLIPFNKGNSFVKSIDVLINSYRIIKVYVIGIAVNNH